MNDFGDQETAKFVTTGSGECPGGGKGSGDGRGGNPIATQDATLYAQLRVHGRSTLLNGVLGGMSLAKASASVAEHLKLLRDAVRDLRPPPFFF